MRFQWPTRCVASCRGAACVALCGLVLPLPGAAGRVHGADVDDVRPVYNVGIVYDGPTPGQSGPAPSWFVELARLIERETLGLTAREFDVRFPADKQLSAGWDFEQFRAVVDRQLADPEVQLVVAVGIFTSSEVCRRTDLSKPALATWAIDVQAQDLPFVATPEGNGMSGVENLNYQTIPGSALRDLRRFKEILPFARVHVIIDSLVLQDIPRFEQFALQSETALGAELVFLPVDSSVDEALSALPADAEAVYLTPLSRLQDSEVQRLIDALIARRLPSMSLLGRPDVERGVLAGIRPETGDLRRARRIALNIQRILTGEDAGSLPVVLDAQGGLTINGDTADAIGVSPPWRVMIEADVIREERAAPRTLRLLDVVREALQANLGLEVTEREVAAGAQAVREARAELKPSVGAVVEGLQIDDDRAVLQAERTLSAGASLTQVLYSDGLRAGIAISEELQSSLERERDAERLDVALQASTAFLNVLRAETLERVERQNLRNTESNLDLARRREQVGFSGPADVYRWESELANDRSAVIRAGNDTQSARAALNRLLHRPLEEPFASVTPKLDDSDLINCCERLDRYVNNPASYRVFREFCVREGLSNSHELAALDATVRAQQRALLAARRTYWSPDLGLSADVGREFSRAGTGSSGTPFDRNNWSLALQATLPLYTGGARNAEVRRLDEQLAALRLERRELAERIELRIRAALFEAGSTFPAIELARESSQAAARNLELVTDAYSRGQVSVIDLLDAQNAALVADEFAANAVYDFLLDLMEVQRATSTLEFFDSDAGRAAWFERLEDFFAVAAGQR